MGQNIASAVSARVHEERPRPLLHWRLRSPPGRPHEQDWLPGRHKALGPVGTKGRAGLVELQGAELVLTEVAVVAGRLLLAWHELDIAKPVTLS